MNKKDLALEISSSESRLNWLKTIDTGCKMCSCFSVAIESCSKYGQVPASFQKDGCEEWDWDDIPY